MASRQKRKRWRRRTQANAMAQSTAHSSEPVGDRGPSGVVESVADIRLFERAVRHGWKIPAEVYSVVPNELLHIVKNPDKQRTAISASRALASMHSQNVAMDVAEHKAVPYGPLGGQPLKRGELLPPEDDTSEPAISIAFIEQPTQAELEGRVRVLLECGILERMCQTPDGE